MFQLDKSKRKSAVDKKLNADSEPNLESQFELKDAENGQDMPMQEAPPSDIGMEATPDVGAVLGEMASALEMVLPSLPEDKQGLVSQALSLLQEASGADSEMVEPEGDLPEEGEDLSSMKGGQPVMGGY